LTASEIGETLRSAMRKPGGERKRRVDLYEGWRKFRRHLKIGYCVLVLVVGRGKKEGLNEWP